MERERDIKNNNRKKQGKIGENRKERTKKKSREREEERKAMREALKKCTNLFDVVKSVLRNKN